MKSLLFIALLMALARSDDPDPEINLDTPGIIQRWGYPAEIHQVQTTDGYILTMHRIPYGYGQGPGSGRPVIFMQHGLECSSSNWITNLPYESAGYIFADAGYDVWLGNFRGNTYSTQHAWLSTSSEEYWAFSWDQMAQYDLPAMLNYVMSATGQQQFFYMGHSMGTMTMFALTSYDPSWANHILSFHALGPVATVGHIGGLMALIAPFTNDADWVAQHLGVTQLFPSGPLEHWAAETICYDQATNPLCDDLIFLICGVDSTQLNDSRVSVYIAHTPADTSVQNIVHFGQGVNNGLFAAYDYGSSSANKQHYGVSTPPVYDIANVNIPTYLYYGSNDILADPTDVQFILQNVKTIVKATEYPGFNHVDFIWGLNASKMVYDPIMAITNSQLSMIKK